MAKARSRGSHAVLDHRSYLRELHTLQVELVKLQRHIIKRDDRIVVLFEGRDAAGKDGTIKRVIEHLSPREVRVVALGKPSDRETTFWYFERFVRYLPAAREMVLFNRSWYNRAGVERVMGFCTPHEAESFLEDAPVFEGMLARSGIKLLKYYLDISKDEQRRRLKQRTKDPLTQWKVSPIDKSALKHWKDYSRARNEMLARTHTLALPWHVVRANDKYRARINVIRDMLTQIDYAGRSAHLRPPDPAVVFPYSEAALEAGLIAP
jgi:polyphosphate kinase